MIPTTPNTRLNPPVSGTLSRQVRALRMTAGSGAVQSKTTQQPVNLREKRLEMQDNRHSRMPLKVVGSCTTHSASRVCVCVCVCVLSRSIRGVSHILEQALPTPSSHLWFLTDFELEPVFSSLFFSDSVRRHHRKRKRGVDYKAEIPFQKKPAPGED